jgi:hypothetical protein
MRRTETFTDSEAAVIRDSLAMTRDEIRNAGRETPNIDTAIEKLDRLIGRPDSDGFLAVA